jgi:hypothetical protein
MIKLCALILVLETVCGSRRRLPREEPEPFGSEGAKILFNKQGFSQGLPSCYN